MAESWGVLFALAALVGWGVGDFLIQKSTREVGAHRTLFVTGIISFFGILPFVYDSLGTYSVYEYFSVFGLSVVILIGALILFEAFRVGKLSVVETVVGIELPLSVLIAVAIGGERLTLLQTLLFCMVCAGVFLASSMRLSREKTRVRLFEKGVLLALAASLFSAVINFGTGTFSNEIDPLFTVWLSHSALAVWCGLYMWRKHEFGILLAGIRKYPLHILGQGSFDTFAWVMFALATSLIPISLATTISESYLIVAALLGYVVGRERLHTHQKIGAAVALTGVVLLAMVI